MGLTVRMLDDSNRLVVRHRIRPERLVDLWLIPIRHWWKTPAWVRLFPLLVLWPIPMFGLSTIEAWGRLTTTVGHELWLPVQNSTPELVLLAAIPVTIVVLGLIHAPVAIIATVTNGAIQRRLDAQDRSQGVCVACRYGFGRLPPTAFADGGHWVICPECGAAWDPGRVNGQSSSPTLLAGYRALFGWGFKSSYVKRLEPNERSKIAMPLVVMLVVLAVLAAHAYILLRPDLLEWVMKYQTDGYWTRLFLPSLIPLAYLFVGSILSGQAEIARLVPPVQSSVKLASTPGAT